MTPRENPVQKKKARRNPGKALKKGGFLIHLFF